MAKIQPITDFPIGRDNFRTDFELFQDWTLDMRDTRINGEPIATGKRAMPLWHNTERLETDPMAETCKASPNGGLVGPAARLERIAMLANNYALPGEVFECEYNPEQLAHNLLEASRNHCDVVETVTPVQPLDWGAESVGSL